MTELNNNTINAINVVLNKLVEQKREKGKSSFKDDSYSRWAVKELDLYLKKRSSEPILVILEEFRDKMETFKSLSRNSSFIFSIACNMTETIIDWLIN